MKICLVVIIVCWVNICWPDNNQAKVTQDTNLHQKPSAQSTVTARLKTSQKVSVFSRQGGWYRVSSEKARGWIRLFYLRFDSRRPDDGRFGVGALLKSVNKPVGEITLTTGVRGITEKQLRDAKPDFDALATLSMNGSDASEARAFAKTQGLKSKKVRYAKRKE